MIPPFHDTPPDRVTVEVALHNEMDLRQHLARWIPYFRVLEPDRYREYVARVAGECAIPTLTVLMGENTRI